MEPIAGRDELSRRVLERGLCAACGACVGRCPYLTSFKGRTVLLDRCTVEQGRCFAHCPMTFFDREEASRLVFGLPYEDGLEIGLAKEVVAARARDATIAAAGQGGGTVTSLVVAALDWGIIDAAILTGTPEGGKYPAGFTATTPEEVLACSGTRYVGSHGLAALKGALEKGYRNIGVVGVPCQVKSVRKMALYDLKEERYRDRIRLVIGLFCNWAFSCREFVDFLALEFPSSVIRRMHIPPPPANCLDVETDRGVTSISLDRLRPMIQAGCSECGDMTAEFADVSVGMYEGRPGWNTLIVRSQEGLELIERAIAEGRLEIEPFPESNLQHLKTASANKKTRVPIE